MSREEVSFDVYCPTCKMLVQARVIARGFGQYRQDAANPLDEVDTEYHGEHYSIGLCGRCNGPFLIRESLYGVPGAFETVTEKAVLYPVLSGPPFEGLPKAVADSVAQAHRCLDTSSPDACALMCRRALEVACSFLSANGRNLAERLDDLNSEKRIDARMRDWAHGIRLVGNEAAHETEASVGIDDARDILEFTDAFLTYVFILDAKYRAFKGRREAQTQGGGSFPAHQAPGDPRRAR